MTKPRLLLHPSLALALLGALLGPVAARGQVAVTVDARSVLADLSQRPVGINSNYLMDSERRRLSPPPRTTADALAEMRPGFLRFPGGEKSDTHLWSVPPFAAPSPTLARTGPGEWPAGDRRFTVDDDGAWIPGLEPMDFDEFMSMASSVGAEPVLVVCYDSANEPASPGGTAPTRQELIDTAAAWVRYANVVRGYGVKYWAIGNETDYDPARDPGAAAYADDLVAFSAAMKAVDPSIRIGAQGRSRPWFRTVLQRASASIDFLDVHAYPTYDWTAGYEVYRGSTPNFAGAVEMAVAAIEADAPAVDRPRLQVMLSETGAHDWAEAWPDVNDLGHALVLFDILGQQLAEPRLISALYWNTRWIDNDAASLPLGTDNLIPGNPDFEEDFVGWDENFDATAGNSRITTAPGDVILGLKALEVGGPDDGGVGREAASLFTPGSVYTLSAQAKVADGAPWSGGGVTFRDGGTQVGGGSFEVDATAFRRHETSFVAPPVFDQADIWFYKGGDDLLTVDDVRLVTGGQAFDLDGLDPQNGLLATGRAVAIWGQFLQDELVTSTGTPTLRTWASRSADGARLTVFLLNKDGVAQDTLVGLQGHPGVAVARRFVLTGTGPDDATPTWGQVADLPVVGDEMRLTLPPTSVTVLDLIAPAGRAPRAFYVSPAGDDADDGTILTPWRTVARVNAESFIPGDSIHFEGGRSFPGNLAFGDDDGGTPANPILVTSYATGRATIDAGNGTGLSLYNTAGFEVVSLVLVGGWDAATQSGNDGDGISAYLDLPGVTRLPYLHFDDVEVSGFRGTGLSFGAWPGDGSKSGFTDIEVTGSSFHDNGDGGLSSWGYWDPASADHAHRDLVVRDCRFFSNRGLADAGRHSGNGIVIGDVNGALIERCEAFENGDLCNNNGGGPVGIWAWDAANVVIQFNESHHNRRSNPAVDGGGFDLDGGVTDSVMQYNYSHDNDGAGYLMWQFTGARPLLARNTVRFNVSENDGRARSYGGLYVGGGTAVQDNAFHDNTIFVSPAPAGTPAGITLKTVGDGNSFRNNLVVTTGGLALLDANPAPAPGRAIFQGNAYWAGAAAGDFRIRWGGATHGDLASFRAEGQERLGASDTGLEVDPALTAPGAGGTVGDPHRLAELDAYRLLPGSPLVDAGLDLASAFGLAPGPHDFHETAIPQGAGFDIGAHEAGACVPPGAVGWSLRVGRSAGDLLVSWTDVADATSYTAWQELAPDGPFDLPLAVAPSGAPGVVAPLPVGQLVFLLTSGSNTCGEGPKR